MTMKRSKEDKEVEDIARANCLRLLSRIGPTSRLFRCKTCNRQFSSFQALGGHRASHKRLMVSPPTPGGGGGDGILNKVSLPTYKPKTHLCSICGVEFALGQALGGHMRRHRQKEGPVTKKRDGRKDFWFDLNLTPYENDLEFSKRPPILDCFI
ncbi:hypothetical protein LguiB_001631 [Lonicera macranthoides]